MPVTSTPAATATELLRALLDDGSADPGAGVPGLRPEVVARTREAWAALYDAPQPLDAALLHGLAAVVAAWQGSTPLLQAHLAAGGDRSLLDDDAPADPAVGALRDHVDLLAVSPATATPQDQETLTAAGVGPDEVVLVSQLVAFESYLVRVLAGLAAVAGAAHETATAPTRSRPGRGRGKFSPEATATGRPRPTAYTRDLLEWEPWVEAPTAEELTDEQRASFARKTTTNSVYFRLLSRTPGVTLARSALDVAAFQGPGGLPKAERELAATVASKVNDCVYCASVHARKSAGFSKREEDVDRLLAVTLPRDADWVPTDLAPLSAGLDERWAAVVDAAAHLSLVRPDLTPAHVGRMRSAGLDDDETGDLVTAAAFFAWANRLMLTLGEPACPGRGTD